MKISGSTIARTAVLGLAFANQILTVSGKSPIPIEDEQLNLVITTGFTIVTSVVAWWKNNSFTQKAIQADSVLKGE